MLHPVANIEVFLLNTSMMHRGVSEGSSPLVLPYYLLAVGSAYMVPQGYSPASPHSALSSRQPVHSLESGWHLEEKHDTYTPADKNTFQFSASYRGDTTPPPPPPPPPLTLLVSCRAHFFLYRKQLKPQFVIG